MPYLHFMTWDGQGWISPAEAREDGPQDASYVVPVARNKRFHKKYLTEIYHWENKKYSLIMAESFRTPDGRRLLTLDVKGHTVVMQKLRSSRRGHYRGERSHSDYSYELVEVVPVPPTDLDEVLDETGFIIVGYPNHEDKDSAP